MTIKKANMTNINEENDIKREIKSKATAPTSNDHSQEAADAIMRDMSLQKFKEKLQKLQVSMVEQMDENLTDMVGEVMREMELNETPQQKNQLLYDKVKYSNRMKPSKHGDLPEKQFLARESLLTDLFEVKHIHTIYNIFIVILIILFLNTAVYDVVVDGKLNLGLSLIYWNFGAFHIVVLIWLGMMSLTLALYASFSYWAHHRSNFVSKSLTQKCWDYSWLLALIAYQILFGIIPVVHLLQSNLPPTSSMIVLMEQVRLVMKTHAFVRSNIPCAMAYKPHSSNDSTFSGPCPSFSHFLYYLFIPTLVYRDSYPRTKDIRWRLVAWHLMEVVGVIFYVSFIFERFLMPMHCNFGLTQQAPEVLVVSVFGSMMPATLVFLCGFFCLLHSWLNAFAEMLRFADRMFYKDWWNANSYAAYYRTWNVVVHDWLYTYIYKDCSLLIKGRFGPTLVVFIVSAVVHEYILMFMFRFFYPMLFLAFAGFSASLVFLTKDSEKGGNVFMWLCLSTGTGLLTSMYSMEWYARVNCPRIIDSVVWDFFVPRSWFCNAIGSAGMEENIAARHG